jgi:hypothetical protein
MLFREVGRGERRSAWARLLAKVYEVDVWARPACGGRMSIIAVIRDPAEIRKSRDGHLLQKDEYRP